MSFTDRSEFISAQASEKLTIAHIHANARIYSWTVFSGNIYQKTVPYFSTTLKQGSTPITQVFSIGSLTANTWFYETDTSTLYTNLNGTDPNTVEMIGAYRLFYADGPATLSWDLTDTGDHVYYDGRILKSPQFKHKVGVDQKLVSVIG